ncbi:uncharacterized protein LOC144666235 isoform X2 [Oculina patagonica]
MVLRQQDIMNDGDIVKEGHLRRLKTQKKRFFVLRSSPRKGKSRLEYYESEKKFRLKGSPKRVIYLANCLTIAKKEDSKHKSVFVLYTREDKFGLIADSEDELNSWLKSLKIEQKKDEVLNASVSTWPVSVKPRGLGTSKNLTGQYDLQLSSRNLALVKKDTKEPVTEVELVSIRRCGHTDCFFFMELGRSAVTGAGELWIQVDDQIIAQNMHEAILGAMHNISTSDIQPTVRRRCESEGKRGKSRPRPVSAVIYPPSRGRSDTEPSSPQALFRTSSSSSTRNLSESDSSPRNKTSVLNRLLPRRRSKEVINGSLDSAAIKQEEQSSEFSDKVLISPPTNSTPSMEQKDEQPEYMNVGPGRVEEPSSAEDYIKMGGGRRKSSGSYIDMELSKSKAVKAFREQAQPTSKMTQTTPEGGYMDMTSLRKQPFDKQNGNAKTQSTSARSEFVQQKRSSSPRQLRTTESALPNKPDIREFVCIKKSPSTARRNSSQDYVSMSPLAVPADESRSYVNISPGSNSPRSRSPNSVLINQQEEANRSYVNFSPGESFGNRAKHFESPSPRKLLNSSADSSSYEDMHSYMNFSPGKTVEQKSATSNFRKRSLESILLEQPREYENVDLSGIAKSRSAVDVPEYVNFVPGKTFECSNNDSLLTNGDADPSIVKALDYVNLSPGKVQDENERFRRSPRSNRRESEPARLQPPKFTGSSPLGSTREDEEIVHLNYVMLDLNKAENTSESPSRQRKRPPNIDLSSCRQASPGPKSAPVKSAYAEVDFTKSDGIRQARQEIREPANTPV